ncbi:hypothetical protein Tco_0870620 [Tanacetum coccineum]
MLRHVSLKERPIVVLGLRGGLLGANPIPHRSLSILEEALGAFGKSQTYWYEGFVVIIFVALEYPSKDIQRIYELFVKCRGQIQGRGYDRGQEAKQKQVEIMDKEVNQAARDSDDALVCCVENTVKDRIMDSGASFHATYCKEELERFKLRSGKVRLADDKTLDIAGVGDVFLKTSFGTSWTLKDVRYISFLKRRLISVGKLDEEGYPVGFGDEQWKVIKHQRLSDMSRIGMSMLASKGNVPDVGRGWSKFIQKAMALHLLHQFEDPVTMILLSKTAAGVAIRIMQTFRAKSTRLRAEALKMLWADLVSTAYLIYRIPYVLIGLCILEEEWQGKETSLTHLKATAQMKCDTDFRIQRVTRLSEAKISHLWTRFMELENDSIVAEHGLSSEITQSPSGSSDTSEGSENNKSFKDSGRSMQYTLKDGSSPRRECFRESTWYKNPPESPGLRLPAEKKASQRLWMFKVKEEQDRSKRVLIFVEDSWNEEPCSDVHQVGDEREVEVLRSFNWPPSELITDDVVLPERGYSQFNDLVQDTLYRKSPSLVFG